MSRKGKNKNMPLTDTCIGCLKNANTNKKVVCHLIGEGREANQTEKDQLSAKSSWLNQS